MSISLNSILYYSKIHPHSSTLSSPASPTAKTERNVSSWIYEFVRYKDNLWPKLLYWPLITGFFLAITTASLLPPIARSERTAEILSTNQQGGTIRIGLIAPLSGELSSIGRVTKNAAQLAIAQVNEAGGLQVDSNRYNIRLLIEDNQSDPEASVQSARRLIAIEDVAAIIGPQSSRQAVPTGELVNDRQTPMISPWSTNPNTTKDRPWIFRVPFLDTFQGQVMANFVKTEQESG